MWQWATTGTATCAHNAAWTLSPPARHSPTHTARQGLRGPAHLDRLLTVVLRPNHPSCLAAGDGLARWLLFVRSHWLRMPPRLLIPHLVRKAWIARFPQVRDAVQDVK